MSLNSGARVGPYEILSALGAGGMGEVYRARDTRLDRLVALKLLPAAVASDPERLERFEREARAASALNHPAIVTIYEVGSTGAQPWISMELVEGQTLRWLLDGGALPLRRGLTIAAQMAEGLAKAHEAGIVHRDLKPENVMVSADGFAKILDFGLARLTGDQHAGETNVETRLRVTEPGRVLGTLAYMSPEQASGASIDFRSDQFSFGAVLYEMLTGRRAFERGSAAETLSALLRDDPRAIGELNAAVPTPVRWMVERSLEKQPVDRYDSTRDLARDLAKAREHVSDLSPSVSTEKRRKKVKSRERIAWAALATLLAATAGLLAYVRRPAAPPERPVARFTVTAPEGGAVMMAALRGSPVAVSPDGRQLLAVVTEPDGQQYLWVRSLDALAWRRLAGTDGAVAPFWSPDSRAVAFSRQDKLQQVTLSGGEVRTIDDGPAFGGTWNRDDVILFARPTGLYRVSASGGAPLAVAEGRNMIWPVFLPDGRHFICLEIEGERTGIHLMSLDSREDALLKVVSVNDVGVLGFTAPNYLLFVENRALMAQAVDLAAKTVAGEPIRVAENVDLHPPSSAFGVSMTGTLAYAETGFTISDLTWARSDGTRIGAAVPRVATPLFALSPDGGRVAIGRDDTTPYSVWINDLGRNTANPVTFNAFACCPVWSPDGTQIAFASARDSPPNLYLTKPGTGAPDERLFSSPLASYPHDWTKDGQFLVYGVDDPSTKRDVWVLPLLGDRTPRPLLNTGFNEWDARVSPDGRWIAYVSDAPGRAEVYVARFPDGSDRRPVSVAGGSGPVWKSDSRQLYYRDQESILAVSVAPGERFETSPPARLFSAQSLRSDPYIRSFDVAPDGRFLLNVFVERKSLPLTVVTDWRAGLVK